MKEILSKRNYREKHFLKENGEIEAHVYDHDIHFLKNNKFLEIDNTLIKVKDHFENKLNSFKSIFTKDDVKLTKDNYYLNISLLNKLNILPILEKNHIIYKNLLNNIDINYNVIDNKVKESIIINRKPLLNKLIFIIDTNLSLQEDKNKIIAKDNNEVIFEIEEPFAFDSANNYNHNLKYTLNKNILTLDIGDDWFLSKDRTYPITIDPTITSASKNEDNKSTYIYPNDTNTTRYNESILKSGIDKQGIIYRTLLKFGLPSISTGSQIVNASFRLISYPKSYQSTDEMANEKYSFLTVHELTEDWDEQTANWNTMNDKYKSRIEYYVPYRPSELNGTTVTPYNAGSDITNLVQKWYSGSPNYGIMIKAHKELVEANDDVCKFFSRHYNTQTSLVEPLLIITYRNQNGLEDYMSYETQNFTEGNTYINNYNGNLTASFNLIETLGLSFPINLSLYYNTNDYLLNNDFGFTKGYKLNYHQILKEITIENIKFIEYTDEDGTIHYFRFNTENNTYIDEDNLNLKITKEDTKYIMNDKNNNKLEFSKLNDNWYLTKIIDNNNKINTVEYNTDTKITKLIDGDNNEINISYLDNKISISNNSKTTYLHLNSLNQITSIEKDNKSTTLNYNDLKLIEKITDINNMSIKYEYYNTSPYRIRKITEYGINNELGKSLELKYGFNATTYQDNLGNKNTYTFNEIGNTISKTNLDLHENIKNAMGKTYLYDTSNENKNRIQGLEVLNKTIKNYIMNPSFESDTNLFLGGSVTTEEAHTGNRSMKITGKSNLYKFVPLGNDNCYYTVSAYFKGTGKAQIECDIDDADTYTTFLYSEPFTLTDEFERHDFTFFLPKNYFKSTRLYLLTTEENSICYIDDVQVEEGEVANFLNLFDNSDFSNNFDSWTFTGDTPYELASLDNNINALKINHDPDKSLFVEKKVNIAGSKGDVYYLSFWYKHSGLTEGVIPEGAYPANFLITWDFTNIPEDGGFDYTPYDIHLNMNETEWQYFSYEFVADYDYEGLNFYMMFDRNINETYITNLCLYKGISAEYYNYDENGNLTNIINSDNNTSLSYDKNNQLIGLTTPLGNNLTYEYDKNFPSRIKSSISTSGILNEIEYNDYGNPIVNRTKAFSNLSKDIEGNYYIKEKGTDKYLDADYKTRSLTLNKDTCSNETFNITKENDYYLIKSNLNTNYYLGYINDTLKLTTNKTNAYLSIEKTNNNLYRIKIYNTDKYLKNDLTFKTLDTTDDSFEFFLYHNSSKLFIENTAEYTPDNKFIKSTTDTLGNKTEYNINPNNGLINSKTEPNGCVISYTYDEYENVTSISKNNKIVNYEYNDYLELSKIKSGNKEYNFTYDNFLNLKNVKIGNNITLINNEYETRNGNLLKATYGNNDEITYTYDEFERVKKINKDTGSYNFKYDNFNNLSRVEHILNNELLHNYRYFYDKQNRLINYTIDDLKIKYDYDEQDNVVKKTYKFNNLIKTKDFTYNKEQSLNKSVLDNTEVNYTFDALGRIQKRMINNLYKTEYSYLTNGLKTSLLIDKIKNNNDEYSYKYDNLNNITHVYYNNILQNRYYYNLFNELIKEDDYNKNITIKYNYDNEGNILTKEIYELKTGNLLNKDTYEYNNQSWTDQLTKYNNDDITYDEIGNPLTIGENILTWQNGKELKSFNNITYTYNKDGIRVSKKVNDITTNYILENSNILFEKTGNDMIYYLRDSNSKLIGLEHNGTTYYYLKNLQGDIVGIIDAENNLIASYTYDSWGNIISIKGGNGLDITEENHIALKNPFRYRSYYYDSDTKLYYLNSRYYNPKWGRFINADGIINAECRMNGYNLYTYVLNNPIKYADKSGKLAIGIGAAIASASGEELIKAALIVAIGLASGMTAKEVIKSISMVTTSNGGRKNKKDDDDDDKVQNCAVYALYDTKTDTAVYVGRTNDLERRKKEHQKNVHRQKYEMVTLKNNLTYEESRDKEQYYIEIFRTLNSGKEGCNKRNGIRKGTPRYSEYLYKEAGIFSDETLVAPRECLGDNIWER